MNSMKEGTRYPCHIWEIGDAKEAGKTFRLMQVGVLGSEVRLEDGTVLHINYDEQDDYGMYFSCHIRPPLPVPYVSSLVRQ